MLPWLVAAASLLAALAAGLYAASRAQAISSAKGELAKLREELGATRERVTKRGDGERKRDEELAELRRRLEKTKKRASQAREDGLQESERIRELDEKLRLAQADARGMAAELQRAEAEMERLREAPRPAPRPLPAPAPIVKEAPPPAPPAPPSDEALLRRVAHAEERALALEEQLVAARVDAERLRRKAAAQDRLYLAMRGELDAKKERLRTQQEEVERLRALRLVLADDLVEPPPSDPSDGSTGPPS
jgi:DNA repair exonuclease SbcCD ATPase subunit